MPSKMAGNKDSASSPPDSSGTSTRILRNLAEKQRRDKLNGYISELATIVPMVSMASKRLDKTSILRLSAAHLRISQSFLGGSRKRTKNSFKWRPNYLTAEQIREILESVEGFLLVTTTSGKIMYVSHSVEKFLGHQNIEMIGHSIFSFIHPSDTNMVSEQLKDLSTASEQKNGSDPSRCSFYCRLRERSQPRSEVMTYQFVHLVGHMSNECEEENGVSDDEQSMDCDEKSSKSSSMLYPVLKAFVRVVHSNPYTELSLSDATENEYVTRHSPNGIIVYADHRLATITGHLPHEVRGLSAYQYIKQEDIHIALFAHKLMFGNNGGTGMIVYRLRTRNGGFVYLKSTGYLQFGESSAQIDHFICVNKQLSDDEGEKELKKFRDRFTPHIKDSTSISLMETIKNIQNTAPEQGDTKSTNLFAITETGVTTVSPEPMSEEAEYGEPKLAINYNGHLPILNSIQSSRSKKICLEADVSGRGNSNYSPLTESSLSANSPQSEDTYETSLLSLEPAEGVYSSQEASSSSEMIQVLALDQNQLLCTVGDPTFALTTSPITLDGVTVLSESDTSDVMHSPLITADAILEQTGTSFWQGTLGPNGFQSEISLETPPYSSGEETSKNIENGC